MAFLCFHKTGIKTPVFSAPRAHIVMADRAYNADWILALIRKRVGKPNTCPNENEWYNTVMTALFTKPGMQYFL